MICVFCGKAAEFSAMPFVDAPCCVVCNEKLDVLRQMRETHKKMVDQTKRFGKRNRAIERHIIKELKGIKRTMEINKKAGVLL